MENLEKLRTTLETVFYNWEQSELTLPAVVSLRDACNDFIHAEVARARQKIVELQQMLSTAGIAPILPAADAPVTPALEKKKRGRRKKTPEAIAEIPFPLLDATASPAAPAEPILPLELPVAVEEGGATPQGLHDWPDGTNWPG